MSKEVISTADLSDDEYTPEHITATDTSDDSAKCEFHVQLRSWTMRDMEALIVEAAARVIVGKAGDTRLAKMVEERAIALVTEKIDRHLAGVTAEIINQPILPKYPFGKPDEKPMTLGEFIGLTGRDYLAGYVDSAGKPTSYRHYGKTRMQHLVEDAMQRSFKLEIEKSTNAAVAEVKAAIVAQHKALLEAEKARFREALAKVATPA